MTSVSSGNNAETAAAEYLIRSGYAILARNWRTRYCEIDIVAQKDGKAHFVEVKYRKNMLQGTGLDYITPKKLKQMRFAAEMWVQANNWKEEYCLSAVEVSGPTFKITEFLPECA